MVGWPMLTKLNPDKAFIFRIIHVDNVPWLLENGLHCRSSSNFDSNFVNIGNSDLIDKRRHRVIPIATGGTLSDYIPFYFTPFSPMMYNIKTGWGGITKRSNNEIIILVSSLHKLSDDGVSFVFSDRHAYLETAEFSSSPADLEMIDWKLLRSKDFKRSNDDPGRVERYQAEALVHRHMPIKSLIGMGCYSRNVENHIDQLLTQREIRLKVCITQNWYF